jgi:hypothetical protein
MKLKKEIPGTEEFSQNKVHVYALQEKHVWTCEKVVTYLRDWNKLQKHIWKDKKGTLLKGCFI